MFAVARWQKVLPKIKKLREKEKFKLPKFYI